MWHVRGREEIGAYGVLAGKPDVNKPLGRSGFKWY
jgi:hypothetical protein